MNYPISDVRAGRRPIIEFIPATVQSSVWARARQTGGVPKVKDPSLVGRVPGTSHSPGARWDSFLALREVSPLRSLLASLF